MSGDPWLSASTKTYGTTLGQQLGAVIKTYVQYAEQCVPGTQVAYRAAATAVASGMIDTVETGGRAAMQNA